MEAVDAAIDDLISRRAAERSGVDPVEEEAWRRSEERHKARLREQRRQEWMAFYSGLAASLRASARYYELKAKDVSREIGGSV